MNLIPDEELNPKGWFNLTPMVDFLFLVLAVFAILAVTRTSLFDSEIHLAHIKDSEEPLLNQNAEEIQTVNLMITEQGQYKWVTEFNEYVMSDPQAIIQELSKQEDLGLLPKDMAQTKVLLHIDKKAEWDPVVQLIYSLKKTGYSVHPVHEKD